MKNLYTILSIIITISLFIYLSKSHNHSGKFFINSQYDNNTSENTSDVLLDSTDTITLIKEGVREFKIVTNMITNELFIYQKNKNTWQEVQKIDYTNYYKYIYEQWNTQDWNNDGFIDILTHWKTCSIVHLFDTTQNKFVEAGSFGDTTHLDSTYQFDYIYIRPTWVSTLYKVENFKKHIYATMELTQGNENKEREIIVYKGESNKNYILDIINKESIPDYKEVGFASFDYKVYWQKNYKRFISLN